MEIKRMDLEAAADEGVLRHEQIEPLVAFLAQHHIKLGRADMPRFSGTHVLYYLGGLLAIGAASLFATLAVEALGMPALLGLTVLYALCAIGIAVWFEKRAFGVPASLFATLAIALTPLAVFALQHVVGLWADAADTEHYRDYHRWIDWRWIVMELATLLAGVLMLRRFRYPFLMLPIAFTLWYLSMDVVPALMQSSDSQGWFDGAAWQLRKTITLVFGLLMLLLAFFVDLRSRHGKDYAFWLYLFGLLTFCGALSMMESGELAGKLIYLVLHVGLVLIGAVLGRRTFAVFGGIGIALVLGNLSWTIFRDSFSFVAVLTLLGFALIGTGVWWSKHEADISNRLRGTLPADLRELLAARASF